MFSTVEDVPCCGGYHHYCGDNIQNCWGYSVQWRRETIGTVEGVHYCGMIVSLRSTNRIIDSFSIQLGKQIQTIASLVKMLRNLRHVR